MSPIETFIRDVRHREPAERVLATVLFLDFGTPPNDELASAVRREIATHRGRPTREGPLAIFDGPARAIRCARSIVTIAKRLGSPSKAGLHTGECDRIGVESVEGAAVEIASGVLQAASPGEVVVSSTVKDLVAGSGIRFQVAKRRLVKTAHGEWRLFRAEP